MHNEFYGSSGGCDVCGEPVYVSALIFFWYLVWVLTLRSSFLICTSEMYVKHKSNLENYLELFKYEKQLCTNAILKLAFTMECDHCEIYNVNRQNCESFFLFWNSAHALHIHIFQVT